MSADKCGICGASGISIDDFDNLSCPNCKATGTRDVQGNDFWEPDESFTEDGFEGDHGRGGQIQGDEDQAEEDQQDDGEGDEQDEDQDEGDEDEGEGGEGDFEIVFEARDYEHDGENQDGFPDPVSIVVDGVGKLLPAVRWLRDLTSMRDGKPIGLEEARDAITAVAKDDKRIEVKDVPSEAANIVLTASAFAGVAAREYTPPTPEEKEAGLNENE